MLTNPPCKVNLINDMAITLKSLRSYSGIYPSGFQLFGFERL